MKKITFVNRFLYLFLAISILGFCVFKYECNSSSYAFYNSKITTSKRGEQKGFVFKIKFDKGYSDEKIVNFVDLVVRNIKEFAKDELDNKDYAEKLFDRYVVLKEYGKYVVKFYVYPGKGDFDDVKKFVKKKLLGKSFSDLFENYNDKRDFENYVEQYVKKFRKNFKEFIRKINSLYRREYFEDMYDIFKDFDRSDARTNRILSSLTQNRKVMNRINDIKKILKDLSENKYKYKTRSISSIYDDDYDDDDDEYSKEDSDSNYDRKREAIRRLKKNIVQLFDFCKSNIGRLEDLNYEKYKKTLKSLKFMDYVGIVRREVKKVDGYLENIKEY